MTSTSTSSAPRAHQRPARDLPVLTPASFNKPRLVTGGHRDAINCLDWSLDGRKLASCAMGGEKGIRIWDSGAGGSTFDLRNSYTLNTPHATGSQITRLQWNPVHLTEMVSAGSKSDPLVCFWDVRASATTPLSSLKLPVGPFQITHHPEGSYLAVSDLKENVTFFDRRMVVVDRPVAATTVGDGAKVEQASWQANGSSIRPDPESKALINDISFTASGDHFCIASSSGRVFVRSWASLLSSATPSSTLGDMDVDGESKPADASVVDLERPWEVDAQMGSCNTLRFTKDGRYMSTGGTDAIVNLWSTDEFIALKSFGNMTGDVKILAFSDSGELLASGGEESAVYIFSTTDEAFVAKVPANGPIGSMAWSPKLDILAYSTTDRPSTGGFHILSQVANP